MLRVLRLIFCLVSVGVTIPVAQAGPYIEFAMEEGGDRMASSLQGQAVHAGGGLKFSAGLQTRIGNQGNTAIRLAAGYLFDGFEASIGEVEISTVTIDALWLLQRGAHAFGIGGSTHLSPDYSEKPTGFTRFDIEFDDAAGLLLHYGYRFLPGMEIGLRYLDMQYEATNYRYDASSLGLYISYGI